MTGVGKLILVDPQRIEPDNFNRYPVVRVADIGKSKVTVLADFLNGRPHIHVVPVRSRAESLESQEVMQGVGLIVSAANTVSARLALARLAAKREIVHVSAALTDAREQRGGFVVWSVPARPDLACPACFLTPGARLARGESLLAPVVSAVGAMAAWAAVTLLVGDRRPAALKSGNCLMVDMERYVVDPMVVRSRPDCPACGRRRPAHAKQ
jgi:molybdopterin/thiamine biosynthesis adenylyltransferase